MKNISKILWGFVLIILGIIFVMRELGLADIDIFFDGWWAFFIMIPCAIEFIGGKDRTGSLIGFTIGLFFFLCAQGLMSFRMLWKLIVPVILIIVGFSIVFKELLSGEVKEKVKSVNTEDLEYFNIILGKEQKEVTGDYKGSIVEAAFGNGILDIRNAKIKNEASIKVSSIFSSVEILVPEGVNVMVRSTKIFGGVENFASKKNSDKKGTKTIYIDAFALFGGVDIK